MNSLKTMTLVAVMAAVAYGVFASLHKQPDDQPPAGVPEVSMMTPMVQLDGPGVSELPAEASSTPQFVQGGPVSSVPTLPPGVTAPVAPQVDEASATADATGLASPLAAAVPPLGESPPPVTAQYNTTQAAPSGGTQAHSALPSNPSAASAMPLPTTGASASPYPTTGYPQTGLTGDTATPPPAADNGGYATVGDAPADAAPSVSPSPIVPPSANVVSSDPSAGDIHQQFTRALEGARIDADTGKLAEAHLELSKWYDQPQLTLTEQRQLIDLLDRLAGTVIYSHKHHLLLPAHEVRPGDTLEGIAQAHQVPPTLLAKINGVEDNAALPPGALLKVLPGPFNAVVDLKSHRLTLFLQGRYAGRFPIGIGQDQIVSAGDFEVQSIIDNPNYQQAAGGAVPGEPVNPFGRYWIDLGNQIGIHGTSNPLSVGRSDGQGCILLKDDDIEHVHDILSIGSKVLIRK